MSASATRRTRSRSSIAAGKLLRAIGRPGGRRLIGPWQQDGMAFIAGIAVDTAGTLWVTEADASPKRVSAWDAKTGKFVREFFGSTAYGALGGAINPLDPCLMVGHGCEWRIDPVTGRATCLGCFVRSGMSNSRFGIGSNGKLYLAVASGWAYDTVRRQDLRARRRRRLQAPQQLRISRQEIKTRRRSIGPTRTATARSSPTKWRPSQATCGSVAGT